MKSPRIFEKILQICKRSIEGEYIGFDREEVEYASKRMKEIGCGLTDEELRKAVEQFERLDAEKKMQVAEIFTNQKLYLEQICHRYGITRMTMYRWQAKGKLPAFRKDLGGKEFLYSKECDDAVQRWEKEHD